MPLRDGDRRRTRAALMIDRADDIVIHGFSKIGNCDRQVQHGCRANLPFEIAADDALQAGRLRRARDFHRPRDAAVLAGIDADQVAGLRVDGLQRVVQREDCFVQQDRNAGSFAQPGRAAQVAPVERLFDGIHAETFELRKRRDRRRLGPASVGVHGDAKVRAHGVAHGGNTGQIFFEIQADFHLHGAKSALRHGLGDGGRSRRSERADGKLQRNLGRSVCSAEKLAHGLASDLAAQIP